MNSDFVQALDIDIALQQAITHHQVGRLDEAEQLYRAICVPDLTKRMQTTT